MAKTGWRSAIATSFELFNQTRGVASDDEALVEAATPAIAAAIGL